MVVGLLRVLRCYLCGCCGLFDMVVVTGVGVVDFCWVVLLCILFSFAFVAYLCIWLRTVFGDF